MFRTEFFDDAERFAATVEPLVDSDRVGATMISHLLANHLASPFPAAPLLATVRQRQRPVVAALRVPLFPLVVLVDPSLADPAAVVDTLAKAVAELGEPLVGVTGRRGTAELFASAWSLRTGSESKPRMWELYYRLNELIEPVGVPGAPRLASMSDQGDVELLAGWFCAFRQETGIGRTPPVPDPETVVRNAQRGEVFTIWTVDGRPVAVAGHSPVRRATSKIAPVFTRPDDRRHGYGSAATAAAVRSAQRLGAKEIALFTDAEYVPANMAYRRLGFEPVAEFAEFDLMEGPATAASRADIEG